MRMTGVTYIGIISMLNSTDLPSTVHVLEVTPPKLSCDSSS